MISPNLVFLLVLMLLLGSACQGEDPAPTETATMIPTLPPTALSVDQRQYWDRWEASRHADTYDLGKGPNTYCSKCHAPRNWDPQATIDPPPNCVSCKFSFESEPRIAAGNPLVPEEQWLDIGCDNCHKESDGVIVSEIAWWDQAAGKYVLVADAISLCGRCHADTATIRHRRDLGNAAHSGFQCTDCHDPHSLEASCTESGCHAQATVVARAESSMHNPAHAAVSCVACHDASGLEVGPMEEGGLWMTFRTTDLLGRSTTKPYQSHAIGREVDCSRCHFENNPWELALAER